MPLSERPITIVIPGDLHLTDPGLDNHLAAEWMVEEVNHLIRPHFVQFIGDNVQDATEEQFQLFLEVASRLTVPHFALVGDHDIKHDPDASRFRKHVGSTYGATSIGGVRFIRLNTQEARPVGLSTGQLAWARGEVDSAETEGQKCLIFQHNYPYQIQEDFDGPGVDEWRALVQTHRVEMIVCGHTHYWQIANDGRNPTVAVRSIGDPEGGPPGYAILHVCGDELAITYRSVADSGPAALIVHPRAAILATSGKHVVSGPDRLRVRTWSDSEISSAQGRIDGGAWFDLDPVGDASWQYDLDARSLAKGRHVAEVHFVNVDHRGGGHRIEFLVDPTGRYAAIPRVEPPVDGTAFC